MIATLPWLAQHWVDNPGNTYTHKQIKENNWIGQRNPVTKDLQSIVANSPKLEWLKDKVLRKLQPDEKLVIITNFCFAVRRSTIGDGAR